MLGEWGDSEDGLFMMSREWAHGEQEDERTKRDTEKVRYHCLNNVNPRVINYYYLRNF